MLLLTSPMAFVKAQTHDLVFTGLTLERPDQGCSLDCLYGDIK